MKKNYNSPVIKVRKARLATRMMDVSPNGLLGTMNTGADSSENLGKDRDAYDDYNNYDNENLW